MPINLPRLDYIRNVLHDALSRCDEYASVAGVAELADALDSKSSEVYPSCGFESHLRQFLIPPLIPLHLRGDFYF